MKKKKHYTKKKKSAEGEWVSLCLCLLAETAAPKIGRAFRVGVPLSAVIMIEDIGRQNLHDSF